MKNKKIQVQKNKMAQNLNMKYNTGIQNTTDKQ